MVYRRGRVRPPAPHPRLPQNNQPDNDMNPVTIATPETLLKRWESIEAAARQLADALTDRWHNPGDTEAQTARAVCAHTKLEIALMRPDEPCGGVRTDGWIEWHGGDRPVPEGTKLVVRLRHGSELVADRPERWWWSHFGGGGDIVAYRLADSP